MLFSLGWQFWLGFFIAIIIIVVFFLFWKPGNGASGGGGGRITADNLRDLDQSSRSYLDESEEQTGKSSTSVRSSLFNVLPFETDRSLATGLDLSIDHTPVIPDEIQAAPTPRFTHRTSRPEELCRKTLEEHFGVDFPSCRPDFLKNPETGRNLELDCYNKDLKIALEYNGIQHYVYPNYTGQTYEEFVSQVRRDIFKIDRCDQNGIYVITVPYNVPDYKIKMYIEYYLHKINM